MNSNNTTTLQFAVAAVQGRAFGGYRRTTEMDISAAGGVMPQTAVLTKGGKHIYPPEKLAIFNSIKKTVIKNLSKFGVKSFGSGSAIAFSDKELEKAEQILKKAKTEYELAISELRANYDVWLDEYIQSVPTQAEKDIIMRSALKADDACSKFSFDYDIFVPTPIGENGNVESMATKFFKQLYEEVADLANEAYEVSFAPEDSNGVRHIRRVGQKAKRKLVEAREKMNAMSFRNVQGGIGIIDAVLSNTQQTGFIDDEIGNPMAKRLLGLVLLMRDADNFCAAATKFMTSTQPALDIDILCGVAQPPVLKKPVIDEFFVAPTTVAPSITPAPMPFTPVFQPVVAPKQVDFESMFF